MKIENLHTKDGLEELYQDIVRYMNDYPLLEDTKFDLMCELAHKLNNKKLVEKCESVRIKCTETLKWLELRQNTINKIRQQQQQSHTKPCLQSSSCPNPMLPLKSSTMNSTAKTTISLSQTSLDKIDEEELSMSSLSASSSDHEISTKKSSQKNLEAANFERTRSATSRFLSLFSFKKRKTELTSRASLKQKKPHSEKSSDPLNDSIKSDQLTQSASCDDCEAPHTETAVKRREKATHARTQYRHSYTFAESADNYANVSRCCSCRCEPPAAINRTSSLRVSMRKNGEIGLLNRSLKGPKIEMVDADCDSGKFLANPTEEEVKRLDISWPIAHHRQPSSHAIENTIVALTQTAEVRQRARSNSLPMRFPLVSREESLKSGSQTQASEVVPQGDANNVEMFDEAEPKPFNMPFKPFNRHFDSIINELLQTEKDYVHSLNYVIENFIPEMKNTDIPQVLLFFDF